MQDATRDLNGKALLLDSRCEIDALARDGLSTSGYRRDLTPTTSIIGFRLSQYANHSSHSVRHSSGRARYRLKSVLAYHLRTVGLLGFGRDWASRRAKSLPPSSLLFLDLAKTFLSFVVRYTLRFSHGISGITDEFRLQPPAASQVSRDQSSFVLKV
jgi:hypothetical protein